MFSQTRLFRIAVSASLVALTSTLAWILVDAGRHFRITL